MNPSTENQFWKKWAPDPYTVASAVLIVFSFPPWDLWPLIWISLIPWLFALKRANSVKESLFQGVWLSYFMCLGGFHWVASILREFGNLPWILSIMGLQLFCLLGQPQFWVFGVLFKIFSKKSSGEGIRNLGKLRTAAISFLVIVMWALLYAGIDWVAPKIFMDTLGHSFYKAKYLRQLAEIGGASLLTFLILLVNLSLFELLQCFKKSSQDTVESKNQRIPLFSTISWQFQIDQVIPISLALIICALGTLYGSYRYHQITDLISQTKTRIQGAAIQANIGDFDKIASENGVTGAAARVISTFTQLTRDAMQLQPRPEFIVWPETSYPSTFRKPHTPTEFRLDQEIETYSRYLGVPLMFGGYDQEERKDFNSFFSLSPEGSLQVYHKSILLIFGEFIPGAETFNFIKEMFPQVGNFGRGQGASTLTIQTSNPNLRTVQAGPIICYEALFPNYVIEAARKGSQFILNVTNDSWFGPWGEPQLHLALVTFRSIETRLPMLRSTNTGISALILPDGEITNPTSIGKPDILNVSIPILSPIPTLIKAWGDWFGLFAVVLGSLGLGLSQYARKSRSIS